MHPQYGWINLWQQGDWVIHTTAIVLIAMSILSWSVMLIKSIRYLLLMRAQRHGRDRLRARLQETTALHAHSDRDTLTVALQNETSILSWELSAGLGVLASIGATAPFVGLFGTVWGIFHALVGLTESQVGAVAQVSGPIGEALVMTALGLAVAIPAVLGYNALNRLKAGIVVRMTNAANELAVSAAARSLR